MKRNCWTRKRGRNHYSRATRRRIAGSQPGRKFTITRFEQYTRRIDDVEGRIEAYDLGLPKDLNHEFAGLEAEEAVARELDDLKKRVSDSADDGVEAK